MEISWDKIIGHAEQKQQLQTMLAEGRLPHALLLAGPDGIGKKMVGRALAAAILCGEHSLRSLCVVSGDAARKPSRLL